MLHFLGEIGLAAIGIYALIIIFGIILGIVIGFAKNAKAISKGILGVILGIILIIPYGIWLYLKSELGYLWTDNSKGKVKVLPEKHKSARF